MTSTEAATRACVLPYLKLGFSVPKETGGRVANLHMDTANINGILSITHQEQKPNNQLKHTQTHTKHDILDAVQKSINLRDLNVVYDI